MARIGQSEKTEAILVALLKKEQKDQEGACFSQSSVLADAARLLGANIASASNGWGRFVTELEREGYIVTEHRSGRGRYGRCLLSLTPTGRSRASASSLSDKPMIKAYVVSEGTFARTPAEPPVASSTLMSELLATVETIGEANIFLIRLLQTIATQQTAMPSDLDERLIRIESELTNIRGAMHATDREIKGQQDELSALRNVRDRLSAIIGEDGAISCDNEESAYDTNVGGIDTPADHHHSFNGISTEFS